MKRIVGPCFALVFSAAGTAFGFDQAADKPPSASPLQKAQPLTYAYLRFGPEFFSRLAADDFATVCQIESAAAFGPPLFFASRILVSGQKKRKQVFEY